MNFVFRRKNKAVFRILTATNCNDKTKTLDKIACIFIYNSNLDEVMHLAAPKIMDIHTTCHPLGTHDLKEQFPKASLPLKSNK